MTKKTCEARFTGTDGESLSCDRDGRHLVHRDGETRFARVPGGALVKDGKRK